MKITETQRKAIEYLISEGAKTKGRWVAQFPRGFSRTLTQLDKAGFIETKQVPIPRSKWASRKKGARRRGVISEAHLFFRFNAAKLPPVTGVQPRISREIQRAILKGLAWTPWRPFHKGTERWGAMLCGTRPRSRKCLKISTHVSYSTGFPDGIGGRIACCKNCLPT